MGSLHVGSKVKRVEREEAQEVSEFLLRFELKIKQWPPLPTETGGTVPFRRGFGDP